MLITALLAYSVLNSGSAIPRDELFLRLPPGTSVERLARQIAPVGSLAPRAKGSALFKVNLWPGIDAKVAREKLVASANIHALDPEDEPVNMNSVHDISRKIRHLEAAEDHGQEAAGLDYLEAYRYFIGQRAFPNDSVDWGAFDRARRHVAAMPTAFKRMGARAQSPYWQFVGPTNLAVPYRQYFGIGPVTGRINAVAYDPTNSKIIYAGAAQGGVWKSSDSGTTWTWLSGAWTQLGVSCIVVDTTNPKTIYVGMGDYPGFISNSFGIMKSTDGGASWSEIATSFMGKIGVPKILMDPTNHKVLVAGTGDQFTNGAVYRSTDGGATWATVIANDSSQFRLWPTLAASVPNGSSVRFYAIAAGWGNTTSPTSRLYVSDDHGGTWQNPASPVNTDGNFHRAYIVAASRLDPNKVFLLDSENVALYASSDQGTTWKDLSTKLPTGYPNFTQAWYNDYIETGTHMLNGTASDVLYLGEIDLNESFDGGNTWQSIGGPTYSANSAITHNDQHAFAVCPTDPTQAIFSGDGGIYSLSAGVDGLPNTVTPLNKNLGVTMFYKIAAHPTNPNYLLGGTQDNASPLCLGDLTNWFNVGGGDGGGCAINPANPQIGYVTAQATNGVPYVTRTADGWSNQYFIPPPVTASEILNFVSPIALAPSSPSNMYWASNYLYHWNEDAQQWTPRLGSQMLSAGPVTNGVVQAIAVAPTDPNRIYTGSSDGAVWMTVNGGSSWVQLNPSGATLPNNRSITSLSVSPSSADDLLVGYSGTSTGHLWHCANVRGAIPPVFSSVSGNGPTGLPDASLNAIARDIDSPTTTWWAGTDAGVFRSTDSGITWQDAGASIGLPSCIVSDLVAVPGTRYLNCATYGMGIWRLYIPVPPPPLQSLTLSPTTVLGGTSTSGTVTISVPAPNGGTSVQLTSSSPSATVPASATIAPGATATSFTVATTGVITATQAVITGSLGTLTQTATLTIQATTLASISLSPNPLVGGTSAIATVSLKGLAPPGGLLVQLSTNNSSVSMPNSVKVLSGAQSATFTVNTQPVAVTTFVNLTANGAGQQVKTILTITPSALTSLTFSPDSVVGSSTDTPVGTVTFNGPTSASGVDVQLKSSDPTLLKVPALIHVNLSGSQRTAQFSLTHTRVAAAKLITVTASQGAVSVSTTLSLNPFELSGFSVYPQTVIGGTNAVATINLNAIPTAKSGAVLVKLTSSSKAVVIGASATLNAASGGQKTVTVKSVPQTATTSGTLAASIGKSVLTSSLQVQSPVLSLLTVHPTTVIGRSGTAVIATLTLSGPAPASGFKVQLSSSNPAAAATPAFVSIPAGRSSVTFTVRHFKVAQTQTVTLGAKVGVTSLTTNLTITP